MISIQIGLLYAHPFAPTSLGIRLQTGILTATLFVATVWTAHGAANDRLAGWIMTITYAMECTASLLLFICCYIAVEGDPDATANALRLTEVSVDILFYGIFVPMVLTVYDSLIAPFVLMVWRAEGSWREILVKVIVACILLPITIAASVFAACNTTNLADVAAEMEDAVVELGSTTSVALLEAEEIHIEGEDGTGEGSLRPRVVPETPSLTMAMSMRMASKRDLQAVSLPIQMVTTGSDGGAGALVH